jgi:outer membrane receptor protein involved in Fe transport
MTLILNILWFVFGGFAAGLAWLVGAALLVLTIVGLPWSAAALRIAVFSFAPFGRQVVDRAWVDGRPSPAGGAFDLLLNIIWLVLAGWWIALAHLVVGAALFVTMSVDSPPAVETVVVRAPRLPPSPADAAFSIDTIPPEVLKTAPRLDDALEQEPGFALFRRLSSLGANPTTQGVSLRNIAGSAASRALVTLDGAPQNDPFGGWVIFTALPPEDIGSATIVKGAGSGPYGAGALTGVVSLETIVARAGDWVIDGEGGSRDWGRAAGEGTFTTGPVLVTLATAVETSNGWIPVRQGRGASDTSLTLRDWTGSGRFQWDMGPAVSEFRFAAYEEDRGGGNVGAGSRARGLEAALSAADPPQGDDLGWRAQIWALASDLANRSVSISANRQTDTPADNEFATPALGLGANLEGRRIWSDTSLDFGFDARVDGGEDREDYAYVNGSLTKLRRAGGEIVLAGIYAEATHTTGQVLLSAGGRLDDWRSLDGHDIESPATDPAEATQTRSPERNGAVPTGRIGALWNLDPNVSLRLAAYAGFRPPTLNELFRSYHVGNNVTKANGALVPERLYGVEGGAQGRQGPISWSVTGFYNRLVDPVTNVTLREGPYADPVAGFVPAGGVLLQRENVGAIDAYGLEGEAHLRLGARVDASVGLELTHARVDGGAAAPLLTGLRPAETPEASATGALDWRATSRVTFTAEVRYEGRRYEDDQNQLPLKAVAVAGVRMDYRVTQALSLFVAADNLFNAAVEQNETTGGVYSYGPPRTVSAGFRIASGPKS